MVLADIRDAPAMNSAWDRWLDPAAKPARMTIQGALVNPAWRVEITGVAALAAADPVSAVISAEQVTSLAEPQDSAEPAMPIPATVVPEKAGS